MIRSNRTFAAAVLLTCAAMLGNGCAATGAEDPGPGIVIMDGARLEVVGPATRALSVGEEHELIVRYVDGDGAPIAQGVVEFAVEGDAAGATLSGRAAETDNDGLARIMLRAADEAEFSVGATADDAEPAVIGISVGADRFGTVDFSVDYRGTRDVASAEVAVFTNTTCEMLRATVPSPRESMMVALRERRAVEGLEVGVPNVLYALGIDRRDGVAAEACADVTLESGEGSVEILLEDIDELTGGTYLMEETLDVTSGFAGPLDFVLDAMRGLTTDPAAWLVALVRDGDFAPGWVRDGLRAFGGTATRYLREALDFIHVPGWLRTLAEIGAEYDRALSGMVLVSELTMGEPNEFGVIDARQRLHTLKLPISTGVLESAIHGEATFAPSLDGETLTMPEHDLAVPFGEVIDIVTREVVFSRIDGRPTSFRGVMDAIVPCDRVAAYFGDEGSWERDLAEAACEYGSAYIGSQIDERLARLWDYDTLHLAENTRLVDSDLDYDRDRFEDGTTAARWTGAAGELAFPGTLTGSRFLDETGRAHPVRDRMGDLR